MQTAYSRIWTWVSDPISFDNNHYAQRIPLLCVCVRVCVCVRIYENNVCMYVCIDVSSHGQKTQSQTSHLQADSWT